MPRSRRAADAALGRECHQALRRPHRQRSDQDLLSQGARGAARHAVAPARCREAGERLMLLSVENVTKRFGGLTANEAIKIFFPKGLAALPGMLWRRRDAAKPESG